MTGNLKPTDASVRHRLWRVPFFDGVDGTPADLFWGRAAFQSDFRELAFGAVRTAPLVFRIEGRPRFGKSSFSQWCANEACEKRGQNSGVGIVVPLGAFRDRKLRANDIHALVYNSIRQELGTLDRDGRLRLTKAGRKVVKGGRVLATVLRALSAFPRLKDYLPDVAFGATSLSRFVGVAAQLAEPRIDSFVVIIDDIYQEHYEGGLFQFVRDVCAPVHSKNERIAQLSLGLVLQPDWRIKSERFQGPGLLGRMSKCWEMLPFGLLDTNLYIKSRLSAVGRSCDTTFADKMYTHTGGVPLLVNCVGNAVAKDTEDVMLKTVTLERICADNPEIAQMASAILEDAYGGETSRIKEFPRVGNLVAAVTEALDLGDGNFSWSKAVCEGVTKEKWIGIIRRRVGLPDNEVEEIDRVIPELQRSGLLVQNDNSVRVVSRLLWLAFEKSILIKTS